MLIKTIKDLKSFVAGDKTNIIEVLHPQNDNLNLGYSLAHASLEVGKSSLPHVLEKCSEVYYILRGIGNVVIGEENRRVKTGDMVYIPEGAVQFIENQGDTKLEFLCIVSPAWYAAQDKIIEEV